MKKEIIKTLPKITFVLFQNDWNFGTSVKNIFVESNEDIIGAVVQAIGLLSN